MAGEWCASAAANTVGNLATDYALPYVSYFFRYDKIVEDFKNQRAELEMKKDRLKNDVDVAKRQTEEIEKDVEDWLSKAEKELGEAQMLADAIDQGNKCSNWCPNWGWRYCLSRKVAKKTLYISKLLESSNFQRVGHRPPLEGIEFLLSNDFMPSQSSKLAFNGIMKALNRDDVTMIGLYGMPGVGKTTLAKEVGRQARESKLFDKVVTVTVSQTPNVDKIRDRLAELFGLKFETNTEEGRAEELWRRLKDEQKILIIVDDVWKEINLHTIGIPTGRDHQGCKILLTTRLQQVCTQMNCQKKFQLSILTKDEAWTLFKDNAGLENAPRTIIDVAKEVAQESKGLPLAIVTMGKALKGESLDEWRAANQRLKDSRHLDNQDVCEGIYSCLKLSYDYLKQDNIQTCFLLCSLFPEDHNISVELLTACGVGVGLFSSIDLIEELRREIHVALTKLQKSSLLESNGERYVRMHDVVRDFAHWITLSGENRFMVKNGLTEWPMTESCGCYTAISLWNSKIKDLPDKLEFPKLKTMLLTGNNMSLTISSTFFEGMKALQVLVLQDVVFSLEALEFLPNLRTLWLYGCQLKNISSFRHVKNLEILTLYYNTDIDELPIELEELCRLKSLSVSSYYQEFSVPPNLISRLKSLQELHMKNDNNVNILELDSLSRLTALTLPISTNQCLQENFVLPKLEGYDISVNGKLDIDEDCSLRRLKINGFSYSFNAFKELFCNVEKLALSKVGEHKNIVPMIDRGGMNKLTSLGLTSCEDMECLIDTTTREEGPIAAFSNLVLLKLSDMDCLKELCRGQAPSGFLQELTDLGIYNCRRLQSVFQMEGSPLLSILELQTLQELESIWKEPIAQHASLQGLTAVHIKRCYKLKSIFPARLAYSLLHLKQLKVFLCQGLEQVFDFASAQDFATIKGKQEGPPALSNLTLLELNLLPELRCIWRPTPIVSLLSLTTMRIWSCDKLTYLFWPSLAQSLVQLGELNIELCNSLEHLIIEEENGNEIVSNMQRCYPLCWPKLKTLYISCCNSLKYVFPTTLASGLPSLEELSIYKCGSLEHLIMEEENENEIVSNKQHCFPLCWSKLKAITISGCKSMKYVFPISLAQGLPCLESAVILNCPQLMQVFNMSEKEGEEDIVLPRLKFLKLNYLGMLSGPILTCSAIKLNDLGVSLLAQLEALSLSTSFELSTLPELRCIWRPTHIVDLQSVTTMSIGTCCKLTYLFWPSLAQTLVHLERLNIWECNSLEHLIIEEENGNEIVSNMRHRYPLCWPKLKTLGIRRCNSMKYVFPTTLARGLPCLEELFINECDSLKHLIVEEENGDGIVSNMQHHYPLCWPKLKSVGIGSCDSMKYAFPTTLAQGLPYLENLKISDCLHLEQVFDVAKENEEEDFVLPRLQFLLLCNLRNLRWFCRGNFFSPSSKEFQGYNGPLFIRPATEQGVPLLTHHAEHPHPLCWPKLRHLKIICCQSMKYVFPMALAQGLAHGLPYLEYVEIDDCPELLKVFNMTEEKEEEHNSGKLISPPLLTRDGISLQAHLEENRTPPLSNLTCLKLNLLLELKCIWRPIHIVNLQSLKTMTIWKCHKLEYLFWSSLAQTLAHLEELRIEHCNSLEHLIIENENGNPHPLCWPKLKTLKISDCKGMRYVFPFTLAQGLPYLESLMISKCPELKQVFGMAKAKEEEDIVFPQLQSLKLKELRNLSCFCSEKFVMSPYMKELQVYNCPLLTRFAIKQGAPLQVQLEDVQLSPFKEYICNAENLTLKRVTYQKNVVPNIDSEGLNDLNFQELQDGKQLECLVDSTDEGHVSISPFFNLVELVIDNMTGFKMLCNGQFPKGFLQNLKEVKVSNCGQLEEVFQINECHDKEENGSPLLSNLTSMLLDSLPELRWIWKGPSHYFSLRRLRVAKISHCKRLKYLFSTSLAQALLLLEEIEIRYCDALEHIISELEGDGGIEATSEHLYPPLLPKLTTLHIIACPRLGCVFQIAFSQVLPQLRQIVISNSPQLKQVFSMAKGKDGIDYAVALPNLQDLHLVNLINLSCFCSKNSLILLPSLERLRVWACPRLIDNFTIQREVNKQAQLKEIFLSGNAKWYGTMSNCHWRPSLEKVEYITVPHCADKLFQGLQSTPLQYLSVLDISHCNRLKSLFSSVLARNLEQLSNLLIEYCEELEEIFQMDQTSTSPSSQAHLQPISLPSLLDIQVFGCSNLRSLFPFSIIHSVSKLQKMVIDGASKLEHIFSHHDEPDADDRKEIALHELRHFRLTKLPSLKSFIPMGNHFSFPSLCSFEVEGCPKLTTSFSMDSQDTVHAKTEATLQVQNNNQPTCNNICWSCRCSEFSLPLYTNLEEKE